MPQRPGPDLSIYKDQIRRWREDDRLSMNDILKLLEAGDAKCSIAYLGKRLQAWGVTVQKPRVKKQNPAGLQDAVTRLFNQYPKSLRLSDKDIGRRLELEGYYIAPATVGRIRRSLGLMRGKVPIKSNSQNVNRRGWALEQSEEVEDVESEAEVEPVEEGRWHRP